MPRKTCLGSQRTSALLIWGLRWNWPLKLAGAAALVIGAISLCHLLKLPNYDGVYKGGNNFGILYIYPLVRLFEFMLGMCCGHLWTRLNRRFVQNAAAWTVAELAAVAAILWYLFHGCGIIFNYAMNGSGAPISIEYLMHTDFAPLYAVLIFVLARGEGLLGRILAAKTLRFFGRNILLGLIWYIRS
jgi:peptidoglycan/LPS O-acetylase OafA/YrhL